MDRGAALIEKLKRLSGRRHDEALIGFSAAKSDLAKRGLLGSGARVKQMIEVISANQQATTQDVLGEITLFRGPPSVKIELFGPDAAEILNSHLAGLIAAAPISPGSQFGPAVDAAAQAMLNKITARLAGDLEDFSNQLWRPSSAAGAPTHNAVVVNGNMHGAIQQGGANSVQSVNQSFDSVAAYHAVEKFENALALTSLTPVERSGIEADLATISAQLKHPSPKLEAMRFIAEGIRDTVAALTAEALKPHVVALFAALAIHH